MTMEACYERLGGDFQQVCLRLPGRHFVERFFVRYLEDDSAELLHAAVKAGDAKEALRLATGLKGVSGNLGFGDLERASGQLVALLHESRGAVTPEICLQAESVHRCHRKTVETLREYLEFP